MRTAPPPAAAHVTRTHPKHARTRTAQPPPPRHPPWQGAALGLVYSSAVSIAAAISCGRGVYWSRSRGSLWRKGDQSGAWQTLLRVRLDCDSDALAFTVVQHGEPPAFCHKSSLSCWGDPTGLHSLQCTLRQRLRSAPAGSYTKRLFDDSKLLRNKLVEEAQELAEAQEPDHVAAEAADLVYFAMVRMVAAGVGLADMESHLDRRALKLQRRPGNDKAHRNAAAAKILAQGAGGGSAAGGSARGSRRRGRWLPVALALGAGAALGAARHADVLESYVAVATPYLDRLAATLKGRLADLRGLAASVTAVWSAKLLALKR